MAVTVHIYYTGVNGNAAKFAYEMQARGLVEQIRAEAGNLQYEYFVPLEDDQTILLIDSWQDQPFLDAHHASPMMAEITRLREKYDLRMRVERYVADTAYDLARDEGFIRH